MECPICCESKDSIYICDQCKYVICTKCKKDWRKNCPYCRGSYSDLESLASPTASVASSQYIEVQPQEFPLMSCICWSIVSVAIFSYSAVVIFLR